MLSAHSLLLARATFLLLSLLFVADAFAYDYPIRIDRVPKGRAVALTITNDGPAPVNVIIELTQTVNTGFSPAVIGSKYPHMVLPGQTKHVTTAVPLKISKPANFSFRFRYAFGDPLVVHSDSTLYRLPIKDGTRVVLRSYSGRELNTPLIRTANAAQFVTPRGTPVVAARPGVVIDGNGFQTLPPSSKPSPIGTYVSILHDDGTWATYGWLSEASVIPTPGSRVAQGDAIATSGFNPEAFEDYFLFAVNANFFSLSLRGIPFSFTTSDGELITPTTFNGQTSPDLDPKYPPSFDENPWIPPDSLVPPPKPPVQWDDEHLSHAQRQALFRQRMLEISDETGSDTVSGSRPLFLLSISAAIFGTFAALFVLAGHSVSKPSGVRGVIWTLLRGKVPRGTYQPDHSAKSTGFALSYRMALPSSTPAPAEQQHLPSPKTPTPSSAPLPADSSLASPTPPSDAPSPQTPSDQHEPPQKQLLSVDHVTLLGLINRALPTTHVVTANAHLSEVTDLAIPPDEATLRVDYVLVDVETGSPSAAILYTPPNADHDTLRRVSQRLSLAGIPSLMFDSIPKPSDLKSRLKRLL